MSDTTTLDPGFETRPLREFAEKSYLDYSMLGEQQLGEGRQPRFGIAHGGKRLGVVR